MLDYSPLDSEFMGGGGGWGAHFCEDAHAHILYFMSVDPSVVRSATTIGCILASGGSNPGLGHLYGKNGMPTFFREWR